MRWRSTRDLPSKTGDTTLMVKWLSPVPGEPPWPAWRWESLTTSSASGAKACFSFRLISSSTRIASVPTLCRGLVTRPITDHHTLIPTPRAILVVTATATHNAGMKLDSKFFDRLRVKPDENRLLRDACPECEAPGCKEPGLYPAPKGRGFEGQYHRFCLDHVREYNKSYNYFSGLPDEAVAKHQKDDTIGHRPTWFIGVDAWSRRRAARSGGRRNGFAHRFTTYDPFSLFPDR